MIRLASSFNIAAAFLALGLAAPAHALSNRAWVSGHGNDAASCGSPANPCRSLQYVHDSIIAAGGEIDILDPAGYGAVTISKALSIVNDGVGAAGVQQATAGLDAITISIGPSDNVTLRGINIDGLGTGNDGIHLTSSGSLTIVNCVVRHFASNGIEIDPASEVTVVSISNTIASDNRIAGISIDPSSSFAPQIIALIGQSTFANNFSQGIFVGSAGGANTFVAATIVDSVITNSSGSGIDVVDSSGTAIMRLGRSVVTGNNYGVHVSGPASASSYGDNEIDGNATADVSGAFPVIPNH